MTNALTSTVVHSSATTLTLAKLQEIVRRSAVRLGLNVVRPSAVRFSLHPSGVSIRIFDIRVPSIADPLPHFLAGHAAAFAGSVFRPAEVANGLVWILMITTRLVDARYANRHRILRRQRLPAIRLQTRLPQKGGEGGETDASCGV